MPFLETLEPATGKLEVLSANIPWDVGALDIADDAGLSRYFEKQRPELVLHLAAQAGVRYSLDNPGAYIQTNLLGFANLLECCRAHPPRGGGVEMSDGR